MRVSWRLTVVKGFYEEKYSGTVRTLHAMQKLISICHKAEVSFDYDVSIMKR